jgi:hypothetical protein
LKRDWKPSSLRTEVATKTVKRRENAIFIGGDLEEEGRGGELNSFRLRELTPISGHVFAKNSRFCVSRSSVIAGFSL